MTLNRDLTNQQFGKLTVLRREVHGNIMKWLCTCECGKQAHVREKNLVSGHTKSCGCLRKIPTNVTTGRSHEPEYSSWKNLVYKRYGGEGRIPFTVEPKWLDSYENFYNDMGPRPTHKHRLQRRVPELGFTKENCFWKARASVRGNRSEDNS